MTNTTTITAPDGTRYTVLFEHTDDGLWKTTVDRAGTTAGVEMWSDDEREGRNLHWWITTLILRGDIDIQPAGLFQWRTLWSRVIDALTFRTTTTTDQRLLDGAIKSGVFRADRFRKP